MATSDWEEVKKLAADFQRTQAASSLQRLSERNCIDLVKKLVQLKLIDVIFTCDGKEYVTPEHLVREIDDELAVNGGRVDLTDVSSALNIDFSHIEAKASILCNQSDGQIVSVLGQLINNEYKERLAEEINARLEQDGVTSINDLTKHYDLPAQFLDELVDCSLGTTILGVRDPSERRTIFTDSYVNQYKARLRGILSSLTRPTTISSIISKYKLPEKISWTVIESLVKDGQLSGSIDQSSKSYVPSVFLQAQKEFVENSYRQNSYLEFDTLSKIGISDPKYFCSSKFQDLILLKSCALSNNILYQLDSSIEEAVSTSTAIDVVPLLPSIMTSDDIEIFVEKCLSGNKGIQSCSLFCSAIIVPESVTCGFRRKIEATMEAQALKDFKDGKLATFFGSKQVTVSSTTDEGCKMSRKEERKKKAAGKSNTGGGNTGGTQGREVKTKATKKKYKPGQRKEDFDSDDETAAVESCSLVFKSIQDLTEQLLKMDKELEDLHPSLPEEIASHLFEQLNARYMEVARKVYEEHEKSSSVDKKKSHAELQSSLSNLHASISIFERGLQAISDESLRGQLLKYLQKSLCTDAVNMLITSVSNESNPNLSNPDSRNKVITKLDSVQKESLTKLSSFLNSSSLEGFLESLEQSAAVNDIFLKTVDKKKEKTLLTENRHNLVAQLQETNDQGLTLHASLLLIFQTLTGCAVHASGKFVPNIIQEVKGKIPQEMFDLLIEYEQLVIKEVKSSRREESPSDDEKSFLDQQLLQLQPRIKELGMSFKV